MGDTDDSLASAGSKKGKARVPRRKKVKQMKRRGTYKAKNQDVPLGIGDPDLADCLFSDDEIRADFLDNHLGTNINENSGKVTEISTTDGFFTSADCGDDTFTTQMSVSLEKSEMSSDSSIDSRPSSASSRPDSSLLGDISIPQQSDAESRPDSAASFTSAPSLSEMESSRDHSSASGPQTSRSQSVLSPSVELHSQLGAVSVQRNSQYSPSLQCIERCLSVFKRVLPQAWVAICNRESFNLLLVCPTSPKNVQREVQVFFNGAVSIFIHSHSIMDKQLLVNNTVPPLKNDSEAKLQEFCGKSVSVVNLLMDYTVCVGANHEETKDIWHTMAGTFVDLNPYKEPHYSQTCRSVNCFYLVKEERKRVFRCKHCSDLHKKLSDRCRRGFATSDVAHPNTPNIFLTPAQTSHKISSQRKEIDRLNKKVSYLEFKITKVMEELEEQGVDVEDHISAALEHILKSQELTENQKFFLEQQLKNSGKKDPRSRKWHPSMIRFALYLKSKTTNTAFEGLRDAGFIQLPCSKTLFDYSHAMKIQEGVNEDILEHVHKKVKTLPKSYQKYNCLLCDEIYVSQNLVYNASDNSLIGYEKLDEVEKEMREFDSHVEKLFSGESVRKELQLAKTMLCYMVKGITSDVKYVVAAYPIKDLNSDMLYTRSWEVIGGLEKAGIKVLVFVCDGAPINRLFIKMHTPISKTKSGVVFDTLNFCSPDRRPLFFISDVCHLLKTIRNCVYNSGKGNKKTRCMQVNGELIVWKDIIRLYFTYRETNLRKSFKLNAQNVYPNKFSCMSVKNAAQVLSATVAQDIEDQNWNGTSELVRFIRYINKFFDCLNGAYAAQGIRTRNENLAPYTDVNDQRFDWLGVPNPDRSEPMYPSSEKPLLQYLQDWKSEVDKSNKSGTEKEKMQLAKQTLLGIEMSIRGFAGYVRYLLNLEEPPAFINARTSSQDPLEQHFSVQRASGGGSSHPNPYKVYSTQIASTVMRDIGVVSRKSNSTETEHVGMKITDEPLPKRGRKNKSCK